MARLTKWGNSNGGVRLPQAVLDAAGLRVGDDLACRLLDNGSILLTPRKGLVFVEVGRLQATKSARKPSEDEILKQW